MRKIALTGALVLIGAPVALTMSPADAATTDSVRTPVSPSYTVSLTSNASGGTWTGHESVSFTNASAVALTEVYVRLWDNFHGSCPSTPVTVSHVTGGTAGALTVGCTALKVTLPAPLAQNRSASIGFDLRVTRLSEQPLELPRINYDGYNARPYRFAYGASATDPDGRNFLDQLVKLDVTSGQVRVWREADSYPGEPVFVPSPAAAAEDDGVVLSVVLDAARGRSMLLVLDAASFSELARAEVPHAIPFGFHGQFTP